MWLQELIRKNMLKFNAAKYSLRPKAKLWSTGLSGSVTDLFTDLGNGLQFP